MMIRVLPVFVLVAGLVCESGGEAVELLNGDVVHGKVLSLDQQVLTLRSESFGELKIGRKQIASIHLVRRKSDMPKAKEVPALPPVALKPKTDASITGRASILDKVQSPEEVLRQLRVDGGIRAEDMKAVEEKIPMLGTPEVRDFVNDRLGGLLSGRLGISDIRKEAISAVDQIKDIQKDLGPQAGALNGYLSILENFIDETKPADKAVDSTPSAESNSDSR